MNMIKITSLMGVILLTSSLSNNPQKKNPMEALVASYDQAHEILMKEQGREALIKEMRRLDLWLEAHARLPYIPSVSVAVVEGDRTVYRNEVRTERNQRFHVASFTKTFVALAALHLVGEGKAGLDEPVNNYYPLNLEDPRLGGRPVTLRDLLTHTAGIGKSPGSDPAQRYPAGYRFYYSNGGFNLAGKIIEALSGMTLAEYVTKHLLKPLEMTDSFAPRNMKASGGLVATVNDLARYVTMLINRGTYRGKVIIREDLFNEIFRETLETPPARHREFRGISWRIWQVEGRAYSMSHGALWNGSGGWIQVFPTLGVGYVFMTNPPVYDIAPFYRFYRGFKGELLKLAGLLGKDELSPTEFYPTLPKRKNMHIFTGTYRHTITGKAVEIRQGDGRNLVATGIGGKGELEIYPTSMINFVYIYPGQTEKGLAFDFTWKRGEIQGLSVAEGYYVRADEIEESEKGD